MKPMNTLALVSLLLLAACKKGDDGGNPPPPVAPPPPPAVNRAPVANAGVDATAMTGETINLSASASSDPDADALTYSWVIASGPAGGTLTNATQATASFQATAAGTYVLEVTVRDPGNLSSVDSLSLTISSPPAPPVFGISGLPAHVVQGEVSTIAVQLPAPAGAGGVRVNLLSSNPAAIEVPASIDVMEGDTLVSFNVEAGATGAATITATAPGENPVTVDASVEPDVLDVVVSSGDAGVMVGGTPVIGVTLRQPAPAGGARVSLTLSNAARASLAASQLDFAPGSSTANTTLTALAPGAVEVSATLDGTQSTERVRLGVIPVAASGIRTSESLIGEKRDAGQITAEQALVYRVLATFGAAELPAEFRGNDLGKLDGGAVREATLQLESLSPTAQAAIGKYLFPPIYSGSWGQAQKASVRRVNAAAAADSCFDRLAGMPTAETLPGWKVIRTASFKIWYPTVIDHRNAQLNLYTVEDVQAAALNVAATIQQDYNKLLGVFGSAPLSDAQLPCNGGDGAIDIYVTRVGMGEKAQVMPYLPGECARPGLDVGGAGCHARCRGGAQHHWPRTGAPVPAQGGAARTAANGATTSSTRPRPPGPSIISTRATTTNINSRWAMARTSTARAANGTRALSTAMASARSPAMATATIPFFEWLDRKYGAAGHQERHRGHRRRQRAARLRSGAGRHRRRARAAVAEVRARHVERLREPRGR